MEDDDLFILDQLLSVDLDDQNTEAQPKAVQNDDELFLSKIASYDLKTIDKQIKPLKSKDKLKKSDDKKASVIHAGDTDSSDDETNRDYLNSKYNECGRELRHLLPEIKDRSEYSASSSSWTQKPRVSTATVVKDDVITDPFFGIRISKPLISSAMLRERMVGRTAVQMNRIKNYVQINKEAQDFVIAGVLVQKSPVRTSQKGAQYVIWTLSDLQGDLLTISLFLFRSAYKELWKSSLGTVIGVLNPSILENREGTKHQATLSVDNQQKIMVFGTSKDYGICKSKKKDGEFCTAFVNTNRCTYCIYHIRQQYQKCSQRSELQSKHAGGGLTALRNKVLGKNEVFYAGKSYMAIPAKRDNKTIRQDNKRLSELSQMGIVTSPTYTIPKRTRKSIASSLETSRTQRTKDIELIRRLNGSKDISAGLDTKTSFNSTRVSTEISLDQSRQNALDVIANLKAKTQKISKLPVSKDILDGLEVKTNFNSSKVSTEVTLDQSRRTALDVIANLKAKTQKIPKLTAPEDNLDGLDTKTDRNSSATSTEVNLDESRPSAVDVLKDLKAKTQNLSKLPASKDILDYKTTKTDLKSSIISSEVDLDKSVPPADDNLKNSNTKSKFKKNKVKKIDLEKNKSNLDISGNVLDQTKQSKIKKKVGNLPELPPKLSDPNLELDVPKDNKVNDAELILGLLQHAVTPKSNKLDDNDSILKSGQISHSNTTPKSSTKVKLTAEISNEVDTTLKSRKTNENVVNSSEIGAKTPNGSKFKSETILDEKTTPKSSNQVKSTPKRCNVGNTTPKSPKINENISKDNEVNDAELILGLLQDASTPESNKLNNNDFILKTGEISDLNTTPKSSTKVKLTAETSNKVGTTPKSHKTNQSRLKSPKTNENTSEIGLKTPNCSKFKSATILDEKTTPKSSTQVKSTPKLCNVGNTTPKSLKINENILKNQETNRNAIETELINPTELIDVSKLKIFKSLQSTPAPVLSNSSIIDLNQPVLFRRKDTAKFKALAYVQQKGPIKNDTANKSGVKRFLENSLDSMAKKPKEDKVIFTDRYKKIMAMTSKHTDVLEYHDLEQQEKYFNKLESREKMEEKMSSTYKVDCKAVKCLNCKYTNFSASELCKREKHVLKVFNAVKRFFKCGHCGNRTVTLDICPLISCKNCGSSKWERTTMMAEKKVRIGEVLSIRGGEQTFINSVESNSNINLLVPDD